MTKQLSLIETLAAVEMGCEWGYVKDTYKKGVSFKTFSIPKTQTLLYCIKWVARGCEIRLTAKEWDWPVCEREGIICWVRCEPKHHTGKWYHWEKRFLEPNTETGSYNYHYVIPDPRSPDTAPPSEWVPEGRRVVK